MHQKNTFKLPDKGLDMRLNRELYDCKTGQYLHQCISSRVPCHMYLGNTLS